MNPADARFCACCGRALAAESGQKPVRQIPPVLWVALVSLGVIVAAQLVASLRLGPAVLLSALLSAGLLVGLYFGHRWAYAATVVIIAVKLVAGFGLAVFAVDCLVLIPVLMCSAYYWKRGDGPPSYAPTPGE